MMLGALMLLEGEVDMIEASRQRPRDPKRNSAESSGAASGSAIFCRRHLSRPLGKDNQSCLFIANAP
jgi:hypothetical protein